MKLTRKQKRAILKHPLAKRVEVRAGDVIIWTKELIMDYAPDNRPPNVKPTRHRVGRLRIRLCDSQSNGPFVLDRGVRIRNLDRVVRHHGDIWHHPFVYGHNEPDVHGCWGTCVAWQYYKKDPVLATHELLTWLEGEGQQAWIHYFPKTEEETRKIQYHYRRKAYEPPPRRRRRAGKAPSADSTRG